MCYTLSISNIVPNNYLVRDPPDDPDLRVDDPPDERIVELPDERIVELLDERIVELLDDRIVEFVLEGRTDVLVERDTDGAAVLREGLVAVDVLRIVVLVEREGAVTDVLVRAVRVAVVVVAVRVAVVVVAVRVAVLALGRRDVVLRTLELPYVRFIDDV